MNSTTLNPRTLPTVILASLAAVAVFFGCGYPVYRGDENAYMASERLVVPGAYERPDSVYVRILGVRRARHDGDLRIDILIAGDHAFEAARQWLSAAGSGGGTANAVLSLRRTSPDAAPISLTFTGDRAVASPLALDGTELHRGLSAGDKRVMLTFILDASPAFKPGAYDVALTVPRGINAGPWDIRELDIALETQPLTVQMSDTSRID